ncbi:MAG: ABC transporter permease [Acidobacteria bacterium]|nr:ABC transporter permease [Acidobacteriota bacterium]
MQTLAQDLRYALRNLRQAPGFTAIAIVTLALGIGANSAIFSVVNGVVLRPLEYREPDDLLFITSNFPGESYGEQFWMSAPEYLQYREQSTSFADMGVYTTGEISITGTDTPIRVPAGFASASLFTTLGVEPAVGRIFTPEEDLPAGDPTVLLSYELWMSAFGGRDDLVGDTLLVNGAPRTVVGIMPPRFDLNDNGVQVWTLLQLDPENPGSQFSHYLYGVGRLREGVVSQQAQAELDVLVAGWLETYPDAHIRPDDHEIQFEPLMTQVVGDVRSALLTLLGAVGFVLLIACANVANLLLARAESRQKEIGVRTALGAGRGRLLRQFVTESILLALIGGVLGLVVGRWGLALLLSSNAGSIPRLNEISLDASVLGFTLGVSVITGLLFGLAPLLHLTADNLTAALREGRATVGRARHRLRQLLVVSEIALTVVLVIGAGLMLRSFSALQSVDPGFDHNGLLTFRLFLPSTTYAGPPEQVSFYRDLKEQLIEIPGVESVTLMSGLPPIRRLNANTMQFEGIQFTDEGPPSEVDYFQFIADDYFSTMEIPLLEGRVFAASDSDTSMLAAVVNETMANMYWPEGALGRRLRQGGNVPWITVVGVVADVKNGGMDQQAGTELYFYVPQVAALGFGQSTMNLVLRTTIDPMSLSEQARQTVWSLDPSLPLTNLQTMDDAVFGSMARPRFLTLLLGVFGGIALLLAAVGTYGVMSYFVAERRREMGIRIALGAEAAGVLMLVMRQSFKIAVFGLVVGVGAALGLSRFVESWLFGVSAFDTTTFVAVPAVLALVAMVACLVPALRATRVDPIEVLKAE